ncbi:TPA_asm: hypothetical protein GND06_003638 [Salmonella enterica subsp. enterica]|nr:hypothetical protein [Salmonella enterica subsp. enterica]
MNTLTQEEVQAISDLKAGYALGHADVAILQNLTHMLLASLNATPIYQVQYGQKWRDVTKERYEDHRDHGSSTRIVYAEPPAPVGLVNDAYLESLIKYQEADLKAAEYELKKNATQAMDYSADREMLKRLDMIMSGSDSGGEISALTVTAQSLVDRCKTLALEKVKCPFSFGWDELKRRTHQDALFFSAWMTEGEEITYLHRDIASRTVDRLLKVIAACQSNNSPSELMTWNPASLEEVNKRSVREPTTTFPPAKGPQIPPMAASQAAFIALHSPKLPVEILAAIKEVVRIRLDFNEFDGDRRGIGDCLERAEQKLTEIINKNAALLDKEIA